VHRSAEVRAVGYDFEGYYGWHYPPPALFLAAALATLPYLYAAIVWLVSTLAVYVVAIVGILGGRTGVLFALGFPAALWNVTAGQNGFLTAALIGGTLGMLERQPALAGVCLGLLTYKPQFGLLFPIVLIADRRWLTIAVATLVAIVLFGLSWLAFGAASWQAFVNWAPISSRVLIDQGALDWYRLQSVFALIRAHGGSEPLAWTVQAIVTLSLAAALVWLWRSRVAFELKAAALATAALLATPYLFMYDLVVLAVAVAFLLRLGLVRGLSRIEIGGLAAAGALILIYPYVKTQVGLAATAIVAILIARQALAEMRLTRPERRPGSA
jgi:arabinofuranan 3-O-arabinosyltransferase